MPIPSKRSFLLSCALLATQALRLPAAQAGAPAVTLLVGDKLDENGKQKPLKAPHRKLFDYLEQELGIVFDVRMYPWPRAERNALLGVGLIFGLPKNAERLRELRYSDAAVSNTLWLVTRSDATFPFNTLDDLRGKTVGAVRGYGYGEAFESARNKLFRVEDDIASRATRLQRLMLKRVDAVLLYHPSWESAAEVEANIRAFMAPHGKEMGLPPQVGFAVLPQPVQVETGLHFAIARGAADGISDRINAALARQRKPDEPKRRNAALRQPMTPQ